MISPNKRLSLMGFDASSLDQNGKWCRFGTCSVGLWDSSIDLAILKLDTIPSQKPVLTRDKGAERVSVFALGLPTDDALSVRAAGILVIPMLNAVWSTVWDWY